MITSTPNPSSGEAPTPRLPCILCVDDDELVLLSLRRLFRQTATVVTATAGAEALTVLSERDDICLVVSDQRMPGMSGTEFLAAAARIAPDVPRILLTGYVDGQSAMEAITRGKLYRLFTKPWNSSELLKAIRDGIKWHQHSKHAGTSQEYVLSAVPEEECLR